MEKTEKVSASFYDFVKAIGGATRKISIAAAYAVEIFNKFGKAIGEMSDDIVIAACPNKRIAHLAKHSKKARVRKKNLKRARNLFLEGV